MCFCVFFCIFLFYLLTRYLFVYLIIYIFKYLFTYLLIYLFYRSDHFSSGMAMKIAKYMNWWPARPVAAAAIARRLSFQIDLAWNFLEAHHESNIKVTNGCVWVGVGGGGWGMYRPGTR